jgi:alanyl-tRNA synthetase
LKGSDIRAAFLRFFEERGHTVYRSDSLIPTNDPSLLFSGAGMNQFKDMFLGKGNLPFTRAATSQKCLRTGDIENVGKTPAHHTFFEMLGNFSFGDYFKREAIEWAWEWTTGVVKLPEARLSVSVYKDDDEAAGIWRSTIGLSEDRIHRFGEHDNFWPADAPSTAAAGTLCGPCSEIFYDWGSEYGCGKPGCDPSCDCRRHVEIWNLVFQQFEKGAEPGDLSQLAMKNIDTGMGLERITAVLQGVRSNFDTDLLLPLVRQVAGAAEQDYGKNAESDARLRRIADHARAVSLCIADGVLPGNEGRGYVVRRLLRRAVLDGRRLGISEPFVFSLVPTVAASLGDQFPDLTERRDQIASFVKGEEERFGETLSSGLQQLERFTSRLATGATLDGTSAFTLYDTFGFPVELTEEILAERAIAVDRSGFESEMRTARERSKGATSEAIFGYEWMLAVKDRTKGTAFVGYEATEAEAEIVALVRGDKEAGEVVDSLTTQDCGEGVCRVVLDRTPFYGEAGGQVGDAGEIKTAEGVFAVRNTVRAGDIFIHLGTVSSGRIGAGSRARASVDVSRRLDIQRNHTATHILHHQLREVLGRHVEQAGSLVEPDRLRLDFSHGESLSTEQVSAVERGVNERILANAPVGTQSTTVTEARAQGAMALFGEKYGQSVRMVSIGEFSKELCGGTHLEQTGQIGLFRIVSEESIAAGVRRITALTGRGAYDLMKYEQHVLGELSRELKAPTADLPARVSTLAARVKKLEKDLHAAKKKALAGGGVDAMLSTAVEVEGVRVLALSLGDASADDLRSAADVLRPKLETADVSGAVLVLAAAHEGKVSLGCWVMPKPLTKRVKAGAIVKAIAPIVGGGGGGRDDMAQAGGRDPAKIDDALAAVEPLVRSALRA